MVRRRRSPLEVRTEISSLLARIRSIVYFAWVREEGDIPFDVHRHLRRGERVVAEADSEIHPQFPPATYYLIFPPEQEFYLPMRWIIRIRDLERNSEALERDSEDLERDSEE